MLPKLLNIEPKNTIKAVLLKADEKFDILILLEEISQSS